MGVNLKEEEGIKELVSGGAGCVFEQGDSF